jgi:hypothetical protein
VNKWLLTHRTLFNPGRQRTIHAPNTSRIGPQYSEKFEVKSIAHLPLEERPHKCASSVHSDQVSTAGEYDKKNGMMHAFKGPFLIEGDEPEAVRSAIVLYDAGLTQLGLGKHEKARRWFELACVRLKLGTRGTAAAGASVLSVRIIHNLGYCYYILGDSEGAMRCFLTALELARQTGLEEIDETAIKNCLGALCSTNKEDLSCCISELQEWSLS